MEQRKKPRKQLNPADRSLGNADVLGQLLDELRLLIRKTRNALAQAVNSAQVLLYWHAGQRIRTEILKDQRTTYGKQIVTTVSKQLASEFGNSYLTELPLQPLFQQKLHDTVHSVQAMLDAKPIMP